MATHVALSGAAPIELVSLVAQVTPQKDAANAAHNGQLQHLTRRSHSQPRWMAPAPIFFGKRPVLRQKLLEEA